MTSLLHHGEVLHVPERMIVAPMAGVFRPVAATFTAEGELVHEGQAIGVLEGPGRATLVESPFDGFLMGMLAMPGERLREGQPVAWLRVA